MLLNKQSIKIDRLIEKLFKLFQKLLKYLKKNKYFLD